jgi:GAF domain-containing protein
VFPLGAPYFGVALQRYAILLDVADVVCSRQQPGQLFHDLLPRLRATIPCNFLNYAVHDPSHNAMQMFLWDGDEPWPGAAEEVAVEESAVGWVWRNQHVLSLDDVEQERRFARGLRWLHEHGARSYCVLPLTTTHHRIGALGIASTKLRAFGVPDQYFLLRVGELIALSLDDTQPQSALIEERERVRLLFDIGNLKKRLESENMAEPQERISQFLGPVQKWAGQSYVGLYLYDQESRSLRLFTREPQLGPRLVADGTAPLEGSVAGRVFRNGKSEILSHTDLRRLLL